MTEEYDFQMPNLSLAVLYDLSQRPSSGNDSIISAQQFVKDVFNHRTVYAENRHLNGLRNYISEATQIILNELEKLELISVKGLDNESNKYYEITEKGLEYITLLDKETLSVPDRIMAVPNPVPSNLFATRLES